MVDDREDTRADAIALGEKVVALLDEGLFTATYKFAVLLGLLDLCLEKISNSGAAPDVITTRELARRVVEIYWPHCLSYQYPRVQGNPAPVPWRPEQVMRRHVHAFGLRPRNRR